MITMWRRVLQRVVGLLIGRPSVKETAVTGTVHMGRHPDPDADAGLVRADAMAPIPHAVIASSAALAPSAESEAPKEPIAAGLSERVGTPPVTAHQASPRKHRPSARETFTERAMVPRTDLANAIKALRSAKGVRVVEIALESALGTRCVYRVMHGAFAGERKYVLVTDAIHAIVARRTAPLDADPGRKLRFLRVNSGVSVRQVADEAQVHEAKVYRAQRGLVSTADTYRMLSSAVIRVRARQGNAPHGMPIGAVAVEVRGATACGCPRIMQSVIDFDSAMPASHPRQMKAGIVRQFGLARNLAVGHVAPGLRMRHHQVETLGSGACLNEEPCDALVRRIQTVWPVLDGTPVDGTPVDGTPVDGTPVDGTAR